MGPLTIAVRARSTPLPPVPRPPPPITPFWQVSASRSLALDVPRLLAIINTTPDSFFDASRVPTLEEALARATRAVDEGADALDIGGESTRPGSTPVPPGEQVARVVPLIRAIRSARATIADIPITVDTTSAAVAQAALDAGADAINDQSAGRDDPDMLPLVAKRRAGIILMHRLARPREDSYSDKYTAAPTYSDVVKEVADFLISRAHAAINAGIAPESIVLDPGLGFGKTVEQNCELVRRTAELHSLGFPLLGASSRKSFVGRVSLSRDSTPAERLPGTLAFSIAQFLGGVRLFRVHDVPEHRAALAAAAHFPAIAASQG